MITSAFILLFIGLFFVVLEFYFPSGLLAILGTATLLTSVALFAVGASSLFVTTLYIILVIVLLVLVVWLMLKKIPRTKQQYSIYLNKDQEGYRASTFDPSKVGKTGIVISDLKPGGYILIEGQKQQAISEMGYIAKGQEVEVIGGREESLIVQRKQ